LPIALIENWVEEIRKFAPSLLPSLYVHKGSGRLSLADAISQYDLVFTSYDTLKIDQLGHTELVKQRMYMFTKSLQPIKTIFRKAR
jgi:SNF2 family DNA or RNA helicase